MLAPIADIPKLYTALAEWLSCLVLISHLRKRFSIPVLVGIQAGSLVALCIIQYLIGIVPLFLWIPGMMVALAMMYGIILLCAKVTPLDAGFYWAIAFISAEFAASLEWQMESFALNLGADSLWVRGMFLVAFYGLTFYVFFRAGRKRLRGVTTLDFTLRELSASLIIAVGVFLTSNISYVSSDTPFSGQMGAQAFYIRTLVDLSGVIMLMAYQDRCWEMKKQQELDAIHAILQRQYEQYQQSRESIELINRKYHDLKHQIGVIRLETDSAKREEYLRQLEEGVQSYGTQHHTGNSVLDTILTSKQNDCQKNNINLTVVADGQKLAFIEVMDLCSIFGNALDNAIESVERIDDPEKRLIRLAVYTQNNFLMIRVENYFEHPVSQQDGEFVTSKDEKGYHGYGIKSIRYVVKKYNGTLSITTDNNWFYLRILIPLAQQ
jgi:hypothetical protein